MTIRLTCLEITVSLLKSIALLHLQISFHIIQEMFGPNNFQIESVYVKNTTFLIQIDRLRSEKRFNLLLMYFERNENIKFAWRTPPQTQLEWVISLFSLYLEKKYI